MDSPSHRITYRSVKRVTSLGVLAVVSTLLLGGAPVWGVQLVAALTSGDKQPGGASFGRSVGISGDYIVVGAPGDGSGVNQARGAVYVFKRSGAAWVEQAKLIGSQSGFADCVGYSVAIEGDVLVAGSPHCDMAGADFGAAYVFRRNADTWVEEAKLVPSGSEWDDRFGDSVAISGERILVGAPNPYRVGHAYVFRWTGTGWMEEAALSGSDTVADDRFGSAIDILADVLIAGASWYNLPPNRSGAAYVFRREQGSWTEESKLTLAAPAGNEYFGRSVAVLTPDQVAVGAPWDALRGSVTVFQRVAGVWAQQANLVASDAALGDRFGSALAAETALLLVGNPDGNGQLPDRGSAYVFRNVGTDWYEDCKVPFPEPATTMGGFAWALAVDGATAVINGYGYPDFVYVYRLDPCIPALSDWGAVLMGLALLIAGAICVRRRKSFYSACLVALFIPGVSALGADLNAPHHAEQLLVRFKAEAPEATRQLTHAAVGATPIWTYRCVEGLALVRVDPQNLAAALDLYANDPNVLYAEPDYQYQLLGVPNDAYFNTLWGMQNTGDNLNGDLPNEPIDPGVPGADIRAVPAWDLWTGDPNFRIALLDSGAAQWHDDLTTNLWVNAPEAAERWDANGDGCPGVCGVDDDGDGLVDEVPEYMASGHAPSWDDDENGWTEDAFGYDFSNPSYYPPRDGTGHGTHVAGTIGAVGNNGIGVVGVNWRCKIVVLRIHNDADSNPDSIDISFAIRAMDYIISNKIKASNNSWGGWPYSQAMYDAIRNARDQVGHIFVAAAGNESDDSDVIPFHPASYNLSNIIAVAATNNDDLLASFSNYGAISVDLGAPGQDIGSTWARDPDGPVSEYSWRPGTSMAAPHVTGVVALLWSLNPHWSWQTVKDRVLQTARPVPALAGKTVTGGVVNAYATINDCNLNGIVDTVEIAANPGLDCNCNNFPDLCDIASGRSADREPNGVPDECEPRGACCLGTTCSNNSESCCVSRGGVFIGEGVTCDVCDVCEGGYLHPCCLSVRTCILWNEECCSAVGGEFYPDKNKCANVVCFSMAPLPVP